LLEANPLQDISNTQKIAAVVFGGKIFDKTAVQKMLAQVKAVRLHRAAASGNIEHVKLLISEGADVNARDQQGWTPALAALYGRKLAVTDLLLEKGADTAAPHLAAYTGDIRGIKRLLEKDTPVDITILHAAAAGGQTDVVEFLIAKGFEVTATTEDDKTPLHYAALGNHQKVAEILMANGAPVDSGKGTPLSAAAWAGHKDMVEFLISKGADINKGPETPLHQAVSYWWEPDMAKLDMAKLLLEAGADINARDEEGNTPLHRAVDAWWWEMAKLFVSKGADVNTKNRRGESPLSTAKAKGRKALVELLRKHGAKPKAAEEQKKDDKETQKNEQTIDDANKLINELFEAVSQNNLQKIKELIAQGVNLNVRDSRGETLLRKATKTDRLSSLSLVETLISRGADVNARNSRTGGTALHSVAYRGYKEVVELLIASGADVDVRYKQGETPLDVAKERGHTEIVEILTKAMKEQKATKKNP
jgi:cytohesin